MLYLTCSIASCQLKPRITNANMLYGQLITRSTCHMVNWSHLNSSWSQFITVNLSWKQLFTFNFSYKLDYVWMHASMSVCTVDSSVCPKLSGSPLVNKPGVIPLVVSPIVPLRKSSACYVNCPISPDAFPDVRLTRHHRLYHQKTYCCCFHLLRCLCQSCDELTSRLVADDVAQGS